MVGIYWILMWWRKKKLPTSLYEIIFFCTPVVVAQLAKLTGINEQCSISALAFAVVVLFVVLSVTGKRSADRPTELMAYEQGARSLNRGKVSTWVIISVAVSAVCITWIFASLVMIGDEVTHYYMLTKQLEDLITPNFYADIPMANGEVETRLYLALPWSSIVSATRGIFLTVQLYQTLFLFQLFVV